MSDYDDGPRRYRSTRTRPRERDDAEYVQETTYVQRGRGAPPRDLVYRPRDESIETIQRDFPPPGGDRYRRDRYYDDQAPRRARSAVGRRNRYRDDDDFSDYEVPAAAGAAGYAAGRARERRRQRRDYDRDRDYSSDSTSPPRHRNERRKSGVGEVLEGLGLGGVAGALLGKSDKNRSRSRDGDRDRDRDYRRDSGRHRHRSTSSGRSNSRGGNRKTERKWAQAAQAAIIAGAVEAFRARKEPGPWTGEKGRRIATAALGAGGIDGFIDRDPDKKSKRHLAEAVIGGLAANRLANGPRNQSSDGRGARSLSRGRDGQRPGTAGGGGGNNGVKELVAGGAIAAAGKAIYDRIRSKSRKRRSPSNSSNESYEPPSRNRHPRGGRKDDTRSRASDTTSAAPRGRGSQGPSSNMNNTNNNGAGAMAGGAAAGAGAGALTARNGNMQRGRSSSSSSSDLEDFDKKQKHMRGKELLTAGLATIATIHAAHGVYSSMEAHEKRHRLVKEGEMTPEEARKKQSKAWVQDAASVGIAALGIKGAFSEWKEMNEHRHEIHELAKRRREKAKRKAKREQRRKEEREMRMMSMYNPMMMGGAMGAGAGAGMMMPQNGGMSQQQGYDPAAYQMNQNIPPPPGPPPGQRY